MFDKNGIETGTSTPVSIDRMTDAADLVPRFAD